VGNENIDFVSLGAGADFAPMIDTMMESLIGRDSAESHAWYQAMMAHVRDCVNGAFRCLGNSN
jgi:hypothetical protein